MNTAEEVDRQMTELVATFRERVVEVRFGECTALLNLQS